MPKKMAGGAFEKTLDPVDCIASVKLELQFFTPCSLRGTITASVQKTHTTKQGQGAHV
jgi:hypothetical protein